MPLQFDTIDHQIFLSRLNSGFLFVWFLHSLMSPLPPSNGFSHTAQTDISPLESIIRLRHHHSSSAMVCLRAQYLGPHSLRPVHYTSLRDHTANRPLCKPSLAFRR